MKLIKIINVDYFEVVIYYYSFHSDVKIRGDIKNEIESEIKDGVKFKKFNIVKFYVRLTCKTKPYSLAAS